MLPAAYSLVMMKGGSRTRTGTASRTAITTRTQYRCGHPSEPKRCCIHSGIRIQGIFRDRHTIPKNMPVKKAVEINIQALAKLKERIARLPHERILDCHLNPAEHRGELEDILIRKLVRKPCHRTFLQDWMFQPRHQAGRDRHRSAKNSFRELGELRQRLPQYKTKDGVMQNQPEGVSESDP